MSRGFHFLEIWELDSKNLPVGSMPRGHRDTRHALFGEHHEEVRR
jgi:hypothetical protein